MSDDIFHTDLDQPSSGVTLAEEPEVDKGVRLLRVMREFVASEHGLTAFLVDGQPLVIVKLNPALHDLGIADPPDVEL